MTAAMAQDTLYIAFYYYQPTPPGREWLNVKPWDVEHPKQRSRRFARQGGGLVDS